MAMKKIFLTITLLCACFFVKAQDLKDLNNLLNNKDISTIYISKAMLNLVPSEYVDDISMTGINFENITKTLDGIYIFTSENEEGIKQIKKEFDPLSNNSNNEILMLIKDDESLVKILGQKIKDGYKDLLMIVEDSHVTYGENHKEYKYGEYSAFLFKGFIPQKQIEEMINNNLEK